MMPETQERTGGILTIRRASSHPEGLILLSTYIIEKTPIGDIPKQYIFSKGTPLYVEDQEDFDAFRAMECLNDPPRNREDPRLTSPMFDVGEAVEPGPDMLTPERQAELIGLMEATLRALGKDPKDFLLQSPTMGVTSGALPEEAKVTGQL